MPEADDINHWSFCQISHNSTETEKYTEYRATSAAQLKILQHAENCGLYLSESRQGSEITLHRHTIEDYFNGQLNRPECPDKTTNQLPFCQITNNNKNNI